MTFIPSDSSSDDDSIFDEEQLRNFQRGGVRDSGHSGHSGHSAASSSSYSDNQGASPYHGGDGDRPVSAQFSNYVIPGNTARINLADVMQNARHCEFVQIF